MLTRKNLQATECERRFSLGLFPLVELQLNRKLSFGFGVWVVFGVRGQGWEVGRGLWSDGLWVEVLLLKHFNEQPLR